MKQSTRSLARLRSLAAPVLIGFLAAGAADPVPAGSGTLTVGESTYTFADAVAFHAMNLGLMKLASVPSEVTVAGKEAKGRTTLSQPVDFLGEPYTFDVSFQAPVVARP